MVIENIDIYSLIPYQIIDMIEKLNNALSVVKSRKKTISKVAKFQLLFVHIVVVLVLLKTVIQKMVFKHINVKNVVKDLMI